MKSKKITTESQLQKRKKVSDILHQARAKKSYSQEQLGDLVGFSQNTIARIENNKFSPNADQLYKICEVLDLKLSIDDKII